MNYLLQTRTIWQIVLENSAVPLAFLGVIAYFIKRFFDLKSKKVEIRYTLFHQNKLKYMVEFQAAYFDLEKLIFNTIKKLLKHSLPIEELESLLRQKLDRFNSTHENVRFFISELQKPYFDRISKNLSHHVDGLLEFNYQRDKWDDVELKRRSDNLKMSKGLVRKMIKEHLEGIFDTYRQELEKDKLRERQLMNSLKQWKEEEEKKEYAQIKKNIK